MKKIMDRLEQELIYYIEKLDINEEKQRLSNHLKYFRETMAGGQRSVQCQRADPLRRDLRAVQCRHEPQAPRRR